MQPEISRRCLSCGASLRSEAMFCPECGQANSVAPAEDQSPRDQSPAETPAPPPHVNFASESPATEAAQAKPVIVETLATPAERQKGGAARETLHRASAAARGAIEDNVKRVEKIRHVSTVVLEEASYDASLRFVLVALALFLLVAVLLLVSKVMG